MKVIRYSIHGFEPQIQTHHMKSVKFHLEGGYDKEFDNFPPHLQYALMRIHERAVKFYSKHLEDLKCGIWCFIDGHKDNQSLNHLKRKVPCWEAELPEYTECYNCNWDKFTIISDPDVLFGGFYIPKRELHLLSNIKKR